MQKNIHPKYKSVKIKIGDDIIESKSSFDGDIIHADPDFRTHNAWTKKGFQSANTSNKNVSAFNKKFSGLTFGINK